MTIFLYIAMIFVWGSSWIAIAWQAGDVPPVISVFYRFALAALVMYPMMKMAGKIQVVKKIDHLYFVMLGCCLFVINFICFYYASHYIVSGLMAIIFSLVTLINVLNNYLIYKEKPVSAIKWGLLFGITGLILIFWTDIVAVDIDINIVIGVGLSFIAAYAFSLGNMISVRNTKRKISTITATSYSLIYGSIVLFVICLLMGFEFKFEMALKYTASWIYLALIATIFGFSAYLKLVEGLGANKAAYILVITPLVALALSTIFENYQWSVQAIAGVGFIAIGNFIVQFKK